MQEMQKTIDMEVSSNANMINVDRSAVLSSFMRAFRRRNFNCMCKLDIVFVDDDGTAEGAIDAGGPSREFFRLLLNEVVNSPFLEGPDEAKHLRLLSSGMDI